MGKVLPEISDKEASFIAAQHIFFVATAPLSRSHHVSVSPKAGKGSVVVLDTKTVAYADMTGSGAETAAHLLENGRMTLLFCNFDKAVPPKIIRLHGNAKVILPDDRKNNKTLLDRFPVQLVQSCGFRAIYKLHVTRISQSCGYSLPIYEFVRPRTTLLEFTEKTGPQGIFDYQTAKNSFSIDGLPSLALLRKDAPKNVVPVEEDGFIVGQVSVNNKKVHLSRAGDASGGIMLPPSLWWRWLCDLILLFLNNKPVQFRMTIPVIVVLGMLPVALGYWVGSRHHPCAC